MVERRPASGEAPTRGETPAQEGQGLLTGGGSSWFFSRALGAQRWRSAAAESGSAADAVGSQLQCFVMRA